MNNKKKKFDILLIFLFLLLAAGLFLLWFFIRDEGDYAVIKVNGVETARYDLSVDGEFPLNGGTNILVIENSTARVVDANCPDHVCVRQGAIEYTGQVITCLPNKLTVEIEGVEGGIQLVS